MLDFSRRPELAVHAEILADVEIAARAFGIAPVIVGAFARDLHLFHGLNIPAKRQTEDIDLALALSDWPTFSALKQRLLDSGVATAPTSVTHRLRHRTGLPIDLIPFGDVEDRERKVAWPPKGELVMDVFGFKEATATALSVLLPGDVRARVVSLPALALLKMVSWQDRHYRSPRKDAGDFALILKNYLDAGNGDRLFEEFAAWTRESDFDYERAGGLMLGYDMRILLDRDGAARIERLLAEQSDPGIPGPLAEEMDRIDANRARALLAAVLAGMQRQDSPRSS